MRVGQKRLWGAEASILAIAAAACAVGAPAWAQDGTQPPRPAEGVQDSATVEEVVVTGFRSSLQKALVFKKQEVGVVDTILAEDIGKFPDSNLAESMQRVPGVALARGDGGEGKSISVRGLGAGFTKVRLNGMEGSSQTGSSDILGAGNRGRGFDFNVFASEIFNALTVRKTSAAEVEEGSLGATVDLTTARPLDLNKDFTLAVSAAQSWNEVGKHADPRGSLLVSKTFADGTFGLLGSIAYTGRRTREVGYSAVNILRASDDGGFCTPLGYTPQTPATSAGSVNAGKGVSATNCGNGVLRTSNLAAYNAVFGNRGVANVPGGGTFQPRLPRYVNSEQDYNRIGATLSAQYKPNDRTNIALDGLFAVYDVERRDNYIAGLSFGRGISDNGKPMSSILEASVTPDGTLVYGKFNGVDVRSEGLTDKYKSTFNQVSLSVDHEFNDRFKLYGLVGASRSVFDNPTRTTVNLDAVNVDGFSYDFRGGGNIPVINYGLDITNPANFGLTGRQSDGTVIGTITTRRLKSQIDNSTAEINGLWSVAEPLKLRFGAQYRESDFQVASFNRSAANSAATPVFPAGKSLTDITRLITGFGKGLGDGVPSSWIAIDYKKFNALFDSEARTGIFAECGIECGVINDNSQIRERISSGYGQLELDTEVLSYRMRGNAGLRYIHTEQTSRGYVPVPTPAGSPFPTAGNLVEVNRSYGDWLPSANLTIEITPNLLARLAAAKVIARPELGQLSPGGSLSITNRTISSGNAVLDPIRANTFDAGVEYYFGAGGIVSAGFFYKDIKSYIQTISDTLPFSETGLPLSLLQGQVATGPNDTFTRSRLVNTPGGPLKGFELNYQQPFTFLPGLLENVGILANYTYVQSDITYILASANGVATRTTVAPLIGLSKRAASGTLYYEDKKLSVRMTGSYRDDFIRAIPSGGPDSDILGNKATFYVDGSMSYQFSDSLRLRLEAQNLTDERNSLYVDSKRRDPLYETRIGRTVTMAVNYKF